VTGTSQPVVMVDEAQGVDEAVVVSIGAGSCHSLAVVQLAGTDSLPLKQR
jgi:Na+-transporting NADH:ubiquinone oxidoreductase subunit NqrE